MRASRGGTSTNSVNTTARSQRPSRSPNNVNSSRRTFFYGRTERVPTFGDELFDNVFASREIPGALQFFNEDNKTWLFTGTYYDAKNVVVYRNDRGSVQFTVKLPSLSAQNSYATISLDVMYYAQPRTPEDIPSRALVHALRKLAPLVDLTNSSTFSHAHPLPRCFLSNDFDVYKGAQPSYQQIVRIRPYRHFVQLITSGKQLSARQVRRSLEQMLSEHYSEINKKATKIASKTRKGVFLQPKNVHNILKSLNTGLLNIPCHEREFNRRTPQQRGIHSPK